MEKYLTISKLDAAKRQLETFIYLYFNSGDPVAIHTLAAAAFGIIRDLNLKAGGKPTIQEWMFENVLPEHKSLLRAKLNEAQNFFKHADHDHESTLKFNPESSKFLAWDACSKYIELTSETPPLFQIYHGWMMLTHPEIFTLPDNDKLKLKDAVRTFVPSGRLAYFNDILPVVMKQGA